MGRTWQLTEELYKALHQWPKIVAFFLVGAILGWAVSFLFPTAYRTRAQIYVSLNPYRSYSDTQFLALAFPRYSNVDDYKNWQMSQLSAALFTDDVIQETLRQLRQEDEYWQDIDPAKLRSMLHAEWQTAGVWTLLADSPKAKRSNQAVRMWSRTAVNKVQEAIFSAEQLIFVDQTLQQVIKEQTDSSLLIQEYDSTRQLLQEWVEQSTSLPADRPLSAFDRWKILHLATRLSQYSPGWAAILNATPTEDAPPAAYVNWINQVILAIDNELPILDQRLNYLQEQENVLTGNYQKLMEASLGLSPNLVVKGLEKSFPEMLRSTSTFTLVGGLIGLLVWLYLTAVGITRQRLKN